MLTRSEMVSLVGQAVDMPPAVRAMATLFLAQMTDEQITVMARKAQVAIDALKAKDKAGFEQGLAAVGLPLQFVAMLSQKAFGHAGPNQSG